MTGKGDARLIDNTLVHWSGDHGVKGALQTPASRFLNHIDHIASIAPVGFSRYRIFFLLAGDHQHFVGEIGNTGFLPGKGFDGDIQAELASTLAQHVRIGKNNDLRIMGLASSLHQTQVGADTGGLTRGDDEPWYLSSHDLIA